MKVEVIASGSTAELERWASDRAAREGIDVDDLVVRALAHERHRLKEGPRMDPRTKTPGRRGAAAHIAPGAVHARDVAERCGVAYDVVLEHVRAGLITTDEELKRGRATTFRPVEAFACGVLCALAAVTLGRGELAEAVLLARANAENSRGRSLVIVPGVGASVHGDSHLDRAVRTNDAVVIVSLERVARKVRGVELLS